MSFGKFKEDEEGGSSSTGSSSGAQSPKSDAFLGKGTKVVGSLAFNGAVELDGAVEGEILAKDLLTIGESAIINAKIVGGEIVVRGAVTGDIVATKRLVIKKPARVTGNIASPTLSIEEGVHFEGKCSMSVPAATQGEGRGLSVVSNSERVAGVA